MSSGGCALDVPDSFEPQAQNVASHAGNPARRATREAATDGDLAAPPSAKQEPFLRLDLFFVRSHVIGR